MTGPLGQHSVVLGSGLRPLALPADSSGDLLKSRPRCTAVSSAVQFWCVFFDVGRMCRPSLHWAGAVVGMILGVVRTQTRESDKAHGRNVYCPWRSVQLCKKEV